jgi:hypothetical protein
MSIDANDIRLKDYLDNADEAVRSGHDTLAIHLYMAAFELALDFLPSPSKRAVDGLRKAWLLACKEGDRSLAESIFQDLEPFSTKEEVNHQVHELQKMAAKQLKEEGVDLSDFSAVAKLLKGELPAGLLDKLARFGIDPTQEPSQNNRDNERPKPDATGNTRPADTGLSDTTGFTDNGATANTNASANGKAANKPIIRRSISRDGNTQIQTLEFTLPAFQHEEKTKDRFNYKDLTGYGSALDQMQKYGFNNAGDSKYMEFVQEAASYHGVQGPVLEHPFLFSGSSRDDVNNFAWATCGEIGWPTIRIVGEVDGSGFGAIKEYSPTMRTPWGFFQMAQMPSPSILFIQNLDLLQRIFDGDLQLPDNEVHKYTPAFSPEQNLDPEDLEEMRDEFCLHIKMLRTQAQMFVVGTALDVGILKQPLLDLIDDFREVKVQQPSRAERQEILNHFAEAHPAYKSIDLGRLAFLTDGIGRANLIKACHEASEEAYQTSLDRKCYLQLGINDVIMHTMNYMDKNSAAYKQISDRLSEQFASDLDQLL